MARTKVSPECHLKSWDDVDTAMKKIAECSRVVSDLNNNMNTELDEIKKRYAQMAKPVQEKLDHHSADICQFVTEHRGDMEGKTKVLNFGRTGFRISSKLKYRSGVKAADVIAALLSMGLADCVKTTQTIIADMLKKKPVNILDAAGAYLDVRDEFWFETTQEEIQPAKETEAEQ